MPKQGMGTKLKQNSIAVAELTEISGIEMEADTIEATTLDSPDGFREYISGLKDGGEVGVSGYFNPSDNGQIALTNAFYSGAVGDYSIDFPPSVGASWQFNGIVTSISTSASTEDGIPFEAAIKVTGKPNLLTTQSAGVTALAFSGGGTLAPTVSANIYDYSYVFTAATSITVTVTAANHAIKLYVDGQYMQDLISGTASAGIGTFAAQSSKQITIVAQEAGKVAKAYDVTVVRTT